MAVYVSGTRFTVDGDSRDLFLAGRRIKADCGSDGEKYSHVVSVSYSAPSTIVDIFDDVLTVNLTGVQVGQSAPGSHGSMPVHNHANDEHGGTLALSDLSTDSTHRTVTDAEKSTWDGKVDSLSDLSVTATASELNKLDGCTCTTAELNKLAGFTGTYQDLNYAKDLRATGVTTTEFDYLDGVTSNIQTQLNAKAGTGANTFTGQQTFNDVVVHKVNATDASIDCSTGNYFTDTVSANTTYSFVNVPSGFLVVVLELYDGGDYTITWPSSVKWPADTAPTLTSNGYDVLTFYTDDGGTTWRGMLSMGDSK